MTKKNDKRKKKLFGIPADQLKIVTGGGGVIVTVPREGGVIVT